MDMRSSVNWPSEFRWERRGRNAQAYVNTFHHVTPKFFQRLLVVILSQLNRRKGGWKNLMVRGKERELTPNTHCVTTSGRALSQAVLLTPLESLGHCCHPRVDHWCPERLGNLLGIAQVTSNVSGIRSRPVWIQDRGSFLFSNGLSIHIVVTWAKAESNQVHLLGLLILLED